MKEVDLRTSAYFGSLMISLGLGALIVAALVITKSIVAAIELVSISLVIFTTHRRVKIDHVGKWYNEYIWVLGIRLGERREFHTAEYLGIRKAKISQTTSSLISTATFKKYEYTGYLKISENEKVVLAKRDDKDDLVELLKPISLQLNLPVLDYSSGEARIL